MQIPQDRPQAEQLRGARAIAPPRRRLRFPLMTLMLIGLNLLMAYAQFAAGGHEWQAGSIGKDLSDWALGVKVPSLISHGHQYWRLVTANFLHGSWLHLLANMAGILFLGWVIETFYGPVRMLAIFVLSSVAGAVASYCLTHGVSLGASTGVMGLMGAVLLHNGKYRRHLPERLNAIFPVLLVLLFIQLALDQLNHQVDAFGHLGGLLGGVVMAALLESRIAGPLQDERDWLPLPTALATALGLLAYGGYGLLSTLPTEPQQRLLRAGRAPSTAAEAAQLEQVVEQQRFLVEGRLYLAELFIRLNRFDDATRQYRE
ncbi:MAG TPA: rhomboid family intramembrane serine protease, partial [Armatimonadota bacterium]|nr:rhomboid family intramembrane serine protease [Armatimonadota bacterium]